MYPTKTESNPQMKTIKLVPGIMTLAALAFAGCSNSENAGTTSQEVQKAAQSAADSAKKTTAQSAETLQRTAEQVHADATKTASQLKDQTQTAIAAANEKVQGLIDTAKKLIADTKWQQALDTLQQVGSYKLSPEQQTLVDALKKQVQERLAKAATQKAVGDASKSLDGLLKK